LYAKVFRAMTSDDHDFINTGRFQIGDAGFNDCLITEGKQRLEDTHAARAAGGEQNCSDVIQEFFFASTVLLGAFA
jgi:hypothetical protein